MAHPIIIHCRLLSLSLSDSQFMNILFVCEGFIIDGVASYNLYMSAALRKIGHNVAVVGRWGGLKGFQNRHRDHDVKVLQRLSLTVCSNSLLQDACRFRPDLIISDARRSFPFARKIKEKTGAKLVIIFHDPIQPRKNSNRGMDALIASGDFWLSSEKPIYEGLKKLNTAIPLLLLQRPITAMVQASKLPPRDPFRVLCLGRLSSWKSPAIKYLVWHGAELAKHIPELEIHIVGGGRRIHAFRLAAWRNNLRAGRKVIHILGARTDPTSSFAKSTIVCAGATAAIEAILSNRPVVAVSGVWMGPVTMENLQHGLDSHFGERGGEEIDDADSKLIYLSRQPEIIGDCLIQLYQEWQSHHFEKQCDDLRLKLFPLFDSDPIARTFIEFVSRNADK